MRLTKYFSKSQAIDKDINSWICESSKQKHIIRLIPYNDGILVLFERFLPKNEELKSLEKSFNKTIKNTAKLEY